MMEPEKNSIAENGIPEKEDNPKNDIPAEAAASDGASSGTENSSAPVGRDGTEKNHDGKQSDSGDKKAAGKTGGRSTAEINEKIRKLRERESGTVESMTLQNRVQAADRTAKSLYVGIKKKRRTPKRRQFLKGILIYAASLALIVVAFGAVMFRLTRNMAEAEADGYIAGLVMNTDALGWKRMLISTYPTQREAFEMPEKTAEEILAPAFEVGSVTWLSNPVYTFFGDGASAPFPAADNGKIPEGRIAIQGYDLFSDGAYFATAIICESGNGLFPSLNGWELWNIIFSTDYIFDNSEVPGFPETVVTIPSGAVLTVNGSRDAVPAHTEAGAEYFERSPGEIKSPACDRLVFDGLYFAPQLSAELDGIPLELVGDDENRIYSFRYPEKYTHSITVTVPEGVDVKIGGTPVTEAWAECGKIEGELGELDGGGTGTRPMLNVWTVGGLFGETSVEAEVYGKQLKLLSSDGYNYVFETPAECKYTVTVTCPAGSIITVNGKTVDPGEKSSVKADPAETGSGGMMLGRYDVYELGSIPQALPELDRYVFTGFLAIPDIKAAYGETVLEAASFTVSAYDIRVEFDCLPETPDKYSPERVADASDFAAQYIKYICDGGAGGNSANTESFDANYAALLAEMIPGTAGYVGVMESYRDVYSLRHWDSFTVGEIKVGNYIRYTDSCISCTLDFGLKTEQRALNAEGEYEVSETGFSDVKMNILQVNYGGSWRIWGFTYESTAAEEPQAPLPGNAE
ncbi:MAG: hypothetical protein MJ137_01020 [Clostridia bacterium]|nr:hypothetical protein [Clostridia bacterium]